MYKKISLSFLSVGLVLGICAVPFSALAVQGDPIPGVDVSVEQSPSGIKVQTVQSNATGVFVVARLQPGQYVVKFTPPKPKAGATNNYNSVKSGLAVSVDAQGKTVATFTVGLFVAEKATPAKPVMVTIGANGGTIMGTTTESVPDESFFQWLGHGITRFFASVVNRVRHPFGGSSTPTSTPSPTPKRSSTPTPISTPRPTPTRSATPRPQSPLETVVPTQLIPTPTPTGSGSGSTSTPTSGQTPTPTAMPTPTPSPEVTLISVFPKSVPAGQDFAVNGTNFLIGQYTRRVVTVMLNSTALSFGVIDGQTIFATAQGEPGVYDVSIVTNTGQTLTLTDALTIQ